MNILFCKWNRLHGDFKNCVACSYLLAVGDFSVSSELVFSIISGLSSVYFVTGKYQHHIAFSLLHVNIMQCRWCSAVPLNVSCVQAFCYMFYCYGILLIVVVYS